MGWKALGAWGLEQGGQGGHRPCPVVHWAQHWVGQVPAGRKMQLRFWGASTMGKPCQRCRGGWRLDVGKPPLVRSPGHGEEAATTATALATLQAPSPAPAPRGNTQQVYLCVMCVCARVSRPGTQEWQGTASQKHVQGHTRAVALHRWPPSKSQSESQGFHLKNGCRCSENFF